jgi:hypothetical protein
VVVGGLVVLVGMVGVVVGGGLVVEVGEVVGKVGDRQTDRHPPTKEEEVSYLFPFRMYFMASSRHLSACGNGWVCWCICAIIKVHTVGRPV